MGSIHNDLHKIQKVRILNLNYGSDIIPDEVLRQVSQQIVSRITQLPSLSYYINIGFGVKEIWKGYEIDETRKFEPREPMFALTIRKNKITDRPSILLFTGAPDEDTDKKIREVLSKPAELERAKEVGIKVQSRDIYGKAFFHKSIFTEGNWIQSNLLLLLFQVKAEVSGDYTVKPRLFKNIGKCGLSAISWGLLVGDLDGFVLLSEELKSAKKHVEYSSKQSVNIDNFLSLIIPNRLYSLSADRFLYDSKKWDMIGFHNYEEWEKEMNKIL